MRENMTLSKKTNQIIKFLNLNNKETVRLSDNVSFEVDNEKIISLIIEKEINKIQGITWQISSDSINTYGSYIEIVAKYLQNEMLNNPELTIKNYNLFLKENNIPVFHDNIHLTFMISEISEHIVVHLVANNYNYLKPVTLFHSSSLLRAYQNLLVKVSHWEFREARTRKDITHYILGLYFFFQNKYISNENDFFFKFKDMNKEDSYERDSFPFVEFNFDENLSLEDNLLNHMDEKKYNEFLEKGCFLYSKDKQHKVKIDRYFLSKINFYDFKLNKLGEFKYTCFMNSDNVYSMREPTIFFNDISYSVDMDDNEIESNTLLLK